MENTVVTAMAADKSQFQKEQSDIIKVLLNERYFKPWLSLEHRIDEDINHTLLPESSLEIFITSTCNQSCEYCYLYNNPGIYPPEYNNKTLILNNLKILYNWIEGKNFFIPKIEFYSGEIWHSDYGLEVLEITYQSLKDKKWTEFITIPSNCSFVRNESQLNKIQRYINKFARIGVRIAFSISVDGAIIENEMRPLNNTEIKNDNFYDRLMLFAAHNNYCFHPMVAAKSAHKWIENHKWWEAQCEKYDLDVEKIMMLEVRNNDWDEESIKYYLEFLDYLIDRYKHVYCNDNNVEFFKHYFNFNENSKLDGYIPYALSEADTFAGCTVSNHMTVRLGDMAICPCHRTAYNKYLYGWFEIKDNQIIDIIGHNPQMASRILMANNNIATLECDICPINERCLKGCYGSQLEIEGDPFIPIQSVCNFFKAKYVFLVKKYVSMGILDFIDSYSPVFINYEMLYKTKKFIKGVLRSGL